MQNIVIGANFKLVLVNVETKLAQQIDYCKHFYASNFVLILVKTKQLTCDTGCSTSGFIIRDYTPPMPMLF